MTGLPPSLRRSTTAAAFVVAMVLALLPAPTLAANGLSSGTVTPDSGGLTTVFTFSVHYSHPQHGAQSVTAYLDGANPIPLSLASSDSPLEGTWTASKLIAPGTWTVTFGAESTNGATWSAGATPSVINVVGPPTPTPVPTAMPTATPRPTAQPTPRPTAAPTLPPGATPRPADPTPRAGATPRSQETAQPTADPESPLPSATEGTLAGNPTPGSSGGGGNVPASGTSDPNAEQASETDNAAGVGQAVMLAVGGTLAVSGAGYLAVLAVRRRSRMGGEGA